MRTQPDPELYEMFRRMACDSRRRVLVRLKGYQWDTTTPSAGPNPQAFFLYIRAPLIPAQQVNPTATPARAKCLLHVLPLPFYVFRLIGFSLIVSCVDRNTILGDILFTRF